MFWVFKLSFVVDILALFDLVTFEVTLQKIWQLSSNDLITLFVKLPAIAAAALLHRQVQFFVYTFHALAILATTSQIG